MFLQFNVPTILILEILQEHITILYSLHILSLPQKLLVTQSLVLSLFDYVDVVYVPCLNQRLFHRVQKVQNSCLRFCYGDRKFDPAVSSLRIAHDSLMFHPTSLLSFLQCYSIGHSILSAQSTSLQ